MKTKFLKIFLGLFGLVAFNLAAAQEITERSAESDEGLNNAFVIVIDNFNDKVAEDVWEEFIKDHKSKVKRIRKSKVKIAEGVLIPGFAGTVDIKSNFEGLGKSTELVLWFVQNGTYLSSSENPENYDNIDAFIDNYFVALDIREINDEIENEEDVLNNLEKDLDRLKKDNEKLHKDIAKAEDVIRQSKEDIEINLADQQAMEVKIEEQKKKLNSTKDKLSKIN